MLWNREKSWMKALTRLLMGVIVHAADIQSLPP